MLSRLVFVAVLVAIFLDPRAASAAAPETEIRAVLDAQARSWNRGDVDGFMNGYARGPATEFVSGGTLTRGWQTVRDRYAKSYNNRAKMGALTFSEVTIKLLCADVAIVDGRWQLVRTSDRPHGRFTLIFRRESTDWRIVHDHTSVATR